MRRHLGSPLDSTFGNKTAGGGFRINYDWTVTPTILNHFGMGYSQTNPRRARDPRTGNSIPAGAGIPNDRPGFPAFNIAGFGLYGNSNQQPNDPSLTENYMWSDTVSVLRGRHQIKFGGEYWDMNYNNLSGTGSGG